jgi:hypothetical protein
MAFKLPTLAEMNATRRATPKKPAALAKVDRQVAKDKATREDERKLQAWSKAVKERDEYKDRYTGKPVKRGRDVSVIHPDAAHAHHVEPRENQDVRYDRRNGLTLSFKTHARVEAGELLIKGTRFFTVKGKRYINCDKPVRFVENK